MNNNEFIHYATEFIKHIPKYIKCMVIFLYVNIERLYFIFFWLYVDFDFFSRSMKAEEVKKKCICFFPHFLFSMLSSILSADLGVYKYAPRHVLK